MPRTPKGLAVATGDTNEVDGLNATPSDIRFMVAFIKNLKSKPDIDWDGLVAAIGTTNRKSKSTTSSSTLLLIFLFGKIEISEGSYRAIV